MVQKPIRFLLWPPNSKEEFSWKQHAYTFICAISNFGIVIHWSPGILSNHPPHVVTKPACQFGGFTLGRCVGVHPDPCGNSQHVKAKISSQGTYGFSKASNSNFWIRWQGHYTVYCWLVYGFKPHPLLGERTCLIDSERPELGLRTVK